MTTEERHNQFEQRLQESVQRIATERGLPVEGILDSPTIQVEGRDVRFIRLRLGYEGRALLV
jgi:hypothetical protein